MHGAEATFQAFSGLVGNDYSHVSNLRGIGYAKAVSHIKQHGTDPGTLMDALEATTEQRFYFSQSCLAYNHALNIVIYLYIAM